MNFRNILKLCGLVLAVVFCCTLPLECMDGCVIDASLYPKENPEFLAGLKLEVQKIAQIPAPADEAMCNPQRKPFSLLKLPEIGHIEYLMITVDKFELPVSTYALALIYIDRINMAVPNIVDAITFYKIFLTAITIAADMENVLRDKFIAFAVFGHVPSSELEKLETLLIEHIGNELIVSQDLVYIKINEICKLGCKV